MVKISAQFEAKLKPLIYISIVSIALMGGYWLGITKGYYQRINQENLLATWRQEITDYKKTDPSFGLYEDVVTLLKEKYYGDIDFMNLLYGSIKGAVNSLGDHYTSFSDPAESRDFFTSLDGIYEGVGIELDYINDKLMVVTPLEGSPAALVGIKPKDEILFIDGQSTFEMTLDEAVQLIHGLKGSKVVLVIQRVGEPNAIEFTITRDIIRVPSVTLISFEDGLGVIELTKFSNDTEKLFRNIANDLIKKDVKGIVLDMRNNPGGFLDVGVNIANEFIKSGMIVEERFKDGKITPFYADGKGKFTDIPIVVLVNSGSASAAEIVAGALKDNNRATVVGENTYGKGSVQEIEEMPDKSTLKITVAHWYTPSGQSISQGGIHPDILIKEGLRSGGISDPEGVTGEMDLQLLKAIETLKNLLR